MSWTQPQCLDCYTKQNPNRGNPVRRVNNTSTEQCCTCNKPTSEGVYIRIDPTTVPYPSKK